VEKEQFASIRRSLGKTQAQMAQLLGCSIKAIQSFEQGYRKVPVHAERQILFLLANKQASTDDSHSNCWEMTNCPHEKKELCPAWEFQVGHLCWFINGTICKGEAQQSWQEKMNMCRQCQVFQSIFSL